jgi:hypothetical protein
MRYTSGIASLRIHVLKKRNVTYKNTRLKLSRVKKYELEQQKEDGLKYPSSLLNVEVVAAPNPGRLANGMRLCLGAGPPTE